jgi:hypothetical protein
VRRLTTRTKIGVCAGLLVVAVGVVWASWPKAVELTFVRYQSHGSVAIIQITNRTDSVVACWVGGNLRREVQGRGRIAYLHDGGTFLLLVGHTNCQTEVPDVRPSSRLCMRCVPQPSPLRHRLLVDLSKVGIDIGVPGFEVTVDLPPRETNAPAQPVTP